MIRRDQFVDRYSKQNSKTKLQTEAIDLEKYIDDELVKEENILKMINLSGLMGTGEELIDEIVISNSVHKDINVLDKGNGRSDNNQYAIWGSNITYPNGESASLEPWNDKTLNHDVSSSVIIILPEGTNKNAAKMVANRYLGPLVLDPDDVTNEDINNKGFWGRIPTLGTSGFPTGGIEINIDAVKLIWDNDIERLKIVFKLNP